MNRFDRRQLQTKKKSIMGINGFVRNTSKQKVNSCNLVNARAKKNSVRVTAKKEKKDFNFELLEAKLKNIEEKYGERIMNLEQKLLEQQDKLDKFEKKDAMKQQMIKSLKELNRKKEVKMEKNKVVEQEKYNEDKNKHQDEDKDEEDDEDKEERREVKKLVSQEIEENKSKENVHLTIEE